MNDFEIFYRMNQLYKQNKNQNVGSIIICPYCKKKFIKKGKNNVHCSYFCKEKYWKYKNAIKNKLKWCVYNVMSPSGKISDNYYDYYYALKLFNENKNLWSGINKTIEHVYFINEKSKDNGTLKDEVFLMLEELLEPQKIENEITNENMEKIKIIFRNLPSSNTIIDIYDKLYSSLSSFVSKF